MPQRSIVSFIDGSRPGGGGGNMEGGLEPASFVLETNK